MESSEIQDVEKIESEIFEEYSEKNPSISFNKYLPQLMSVLSIEKNEDEKSTIFEDRLISELKTVFEIEEL